MTHRNILSALLCILSLSAFAEGPEIVVTEYDGNNTQINTFELKSSPPQKELTKEVDGHLMLNINPSNSQEVGVKKLLDANFHFNNVCNYHQWAAFTKDYPGYPDWKLSQMFNQYAKDNNLKFKTDGECFAEDLDKLIKAHPCLAKKGKIQFFVKPIGNAEEWDNQNNGDDRRVIAVNVVGCPYEDPTSTLMACSFTRPYNSDGNFFGPPKWGQLVDDCSAEFKKPDIKKLADAQTQSAHTR